MSTPSSFKKATRKYPAFKTKITGKSKTDPSHAAACDIHNIVERFTRTGVLPQGKQNGQFADVSGLSGTPADRIQFAQPIMAAVDEAMQNKEAAKAALEAKVKADREEAKAKARLERQVKAELDREEANQK